MNKQIAETPGTIGEERFSSSEEIAVLIAPIMRNWQSPTAHNRDLDPTAPLPLALNAFKWFLNSAALIRSNRYGEHSSAPVENPCRWIQNRDSLSAELCVRCQIESLDLPLRVPQQLHDAQLRNHLGIKCLHCDIPANSRRFSEWTRQPPIIVPRAIPTRGL